MAIAVSTKNADVRYMFCYASPSLPHVLGLQRRRDAPHTSPCPSILKPCARPWLHPFLSQLATNSKLAAAERQLPGGAPLCSEALCQALAAHFLFPKPPVQALFPLLKLRPSARLCLETRFLSKLATGLAAQEPVSSQPLRPKAMRTTRPWPHHSSPNLPQACTWPAWPGLAWPGLAWPGLAWPGLAWPGQAWPGLAWPDLT